MKRTRIIFSIAVGTGLLLLAGFWWSAMPVAAGPAAQVTLTPRPQLTPTPGAPSSSTSSSRPPRLHGTVLDWGKGNMPAGVKVILRGDGWEIPVKTDEFGQFRYQDIGNEVAFLNAVVPDDREELQPLATDLPVRVQVGRQLIVNMALYPAGETPDPLIGVEMSASATEVEQDGIVSFTITVHNRWEEDMNQVIVADYLPEGLTYVNSTVSQGGAVWDRGLVWATLGLLVPDASATVTIVAQVDPEAEPGTTILNRVAAYHSENVAVQAEASFEVVKAANGVLPVTGASSLVPIAGFVLTVLLLAGRALHRRGN